MGLTRTSEGVSAPVSPTAAKTRATWISDYATLFKVRVSAMVMITAAAGFYLGSLRSGISPFNREMIKAMIGIAVVTCGSSALNQVLERRSDRLMLRTRNRPMAARRMGLMHGLLVGFIGVFAGSLYLARAVNPLTGLLTLLTAVGYVAIYTPLKQISAVNTFIGAFPGALPPLLGWTAARGLIEWPAVALFSILFVWQFPHFMAIGWMYREDYARGGIRITATGPHTLYAARSSAVQAVVYAVLMFGAALWPVALGVAGHGYAVAAVILCAGYLWYSMRFAGITRSREGNEDRARSHKDPARQLLHASIVFLPLLLAAMMLDARGRVMF